MSPTVSSRSSGTPARSACPPNHCPAPGAYHRPQPPAPARLAVQPALAEVGTGVFGQVGAVEQALVEEPGRPAHHVEQVGPARPLVGLAGRFQHDPGPPGEQFQRLDEADLLELLDEAEDVADLAARPAAVTLPAGIDVERRPAVVVERAQALERSPDRA